MIAEHRRSDGGIGKAGRCATTSAYTKLRSNQAPVQSRVIAAWSPAAWLVPDHNGLQRAPEEPPDPQDLPKQLDFCIDLSVDSIVQIS